MQKFLFIILILTVITGQITRIGNLGVATDFVLIGILGIYFLDKIIKKENFPFAPIVVWLFIFIVYLLASLLFNLSSITLAGGEIGSFLYWVRLLAYLTFILPVLDFLQKNREEGLIWIWNSFFYTGTILSILGFIQLILLPDFSFMAKYGWDPHQGRLLSTWYDPNFLGGFLGLSLLIVLSRVLVVLKQDDWKKNKKQIFIWLAGSSAIFIALFLTYSRSALLAFVIGMSVLTLFYSKKTLIVMMILMSLAVASNARLQERVMGIITVDVTASLRIQNWLETIEDIEKKPILGIGYNTIKYQTIKESSLNSASGRDSSFLTLWLTGGIIGLGIFVSMLFSKVLDWIQKFIQTKLSIEKAMTLASISGLALILVHSMFVNSIFFPHILLFIIFLFAI